MKAVLALAVQLEVNRQSWSWISADRFFVPVSLLFALLVGNGAAQHLDRASAESCSLRCQRGQTDCALRCDDGLECVQRCQNVAIGCGARCGAPERDAGRVRARGTDYLAGPTGPRAVPPSFSFMPP